MTLLQPEPARELNRIYSRPGMRRRYEVWFLKLLLADGRGAWWFRYLLMNPGTPEGGGCPGHPAGSPMQLWATWFPRGGQPRSFIQGYPLQPVPWRGAGTRFQIGFAGNSISEDRCTGHLECDGHRVEWNLRYRSTFGAAMSDKGWIGFSQTPHSDATFEGEIVFDEQRFSGSPLGFGLQGHNCGFRHRHLWNWAHGIVAGDAGESVSTFEALEYEMPLGLRFRRVLWWHEGQLRDFRKLRTIHRDRSHLQWIVYCHGADDGSSLVAVLDGSGPSMHRLPYLRTDCRTTFEVANNSLAQALFYFARPGKPLQTLTADRGAVLEMVGG